MSKDMTEEERKAELDEKTLWRLKEDFKSVVHHLTYLHPEMFGTDEAIEKLLKWTPSYVTECFKKSPFYAKGNEKAPFFTEAFLYSLLGKEDARTLMRLLRDALGLKAVGKHL